jgi:signal transduction histidine kinase
MLRKLLIGTTLSAVLCTSAFSQVQLGTAAEARAMLEKAIAAVKADKAGAMEKFNRSDAGFKDRDLYPFCFNISDGKFVAGQVSSLIGTDVRTLKDKTGKNFGEEIYKAAQEGKITEVSYMFPRPGETDLAQKVSFVTKVSDLGCGVGYYK